MVLHITKRRLLLHDVVRKVGISRRRLNLQACEVLAAPKAEKAPVAPAAKKEPAPEPRARSSVPVPALHVVRPGSTGLTVLFKKCKVFRARHPAGVADFGGGQAPAPGAIDFSGAFSGAIPVKIVAPGEQPKAPVQESAEKKSRMVDLKAQAFKNPLKFVFESKTDDMRYVNMSYPLTPSNPKPNEKVYAWCNVKFDPAANSLRYHVIEPPLTEGDRKEIERIKSIIEEKIDIRFEAIESGSSIAYLRNAINDIIKQFGISLTLEQKLNYEYYILRDFVGLGKLQPILNDPNIEDISCDGANIPVFVYHKDPKFASMMSNVVFESRDELSDFVMKVAQRCGKAVSVADPILEGALPDGSRVQAILETDIARRGSNLTVRKFTKEPITPIHLLNYGSSDAHIMAYLWYLIEHRRSVLVSGPTASGKTSLLNALSLFIPPSLKVVSIEDTPELRLPHPHWVPEVAREGFGTGEHKIGEVSLFDLLKGALRQRPDYIIVGEVRGQEAYILFQAMATGHSGLATIHADSMEKVIDRLTTPPINLPASLIETLDVIVFIKRTRINNKYVRRIFEVHEVIGYDLATKQPKTRKVFKWNPQTDTFDVAADSELLGVLCEGEGISESEVLSEISSRRKILDRLKQAGLSGYRDVGDIIEEYYVNSEGVMDCIENN